MVLAGYITPANSLQHKCLSFIFFLSLYFSFFTLEPWKGSKVHSYIYSLWNESFHSISLLFLMHTILYMHLSLIWEKGHLIAILRKGGWRKRFYGLLIFFDGFLLRFLFFYGLAGFCRAWFEGICYLLSNSVPLLFLEFLATASTHLVPTTAVPKLNFFSPVRYPGVCLASGQHVLSRRPPS